LAFRWSFRKSPRPAILERSTFFSLLLPSSCQMVEDPFLHGVGSQPSVRRAFNCLFTPCRTFKIFCLSNFFSNPRYPRLATPPPTFLPPEKPLPNRGIAKTRKCYLLSLNRVNKFFFFPPSATNEIPNPVSPDAEPPQPPQPAPGVFRPACRISEDYLLRRLPSPPPPSRSDSTEKTGQRAPLFSKVWATFSQGNWQVSWSPLFSVKGRVTSRSGSVKLEVLVGI